MSGMHEAVGFVAARPCRLRKGNMPHTIGVRRATPLLSPVPFEAGRGPITSSSHQHSAVPVLLPKVELGMLDPQHSPAAYLVLSQGVQLGPFPLTVGSSRITGGSYSRKPSKRPAWHLQGGMHAHFTNLKKNGQPPAACRITCYI